MVSFFVILYSALSLVALLLIHWRVGPEAAFQPLGFPHTDPVLAALVSIAFVALVHWLSLVALRHWRTLRNCAVQIRRILGELTVAETMFIACASGIGEELFFRGWLLNEIGLFPSSLIFGIVHFPPNRDWIFWPFFAAALGVALGALCLWTDTLLFAIGVHAGVNFLNLFKLPAEG